MYNSRLSGGAPDYKLNDVLGSKFVSFMNKVKANPDLSEYTFEKLDREGYYRHPGNSYKGTDVHYDFSEYVTAASAAFREIEGPDFQKSLYAENFAEDIGRMFDNFIRGNAGSMLALPQEQLTVDQLPYHHSTSKPLVPGFHLMPYTQAYRGNYVKTNNFSALTRAILYLDLYLGNFDQELDEAMTILRADNKIFNKLVNEITRQFLNEIYATRTDVEPAQESTVMDYVKKGVIDGLAGIATAIIQRNRELTPSTGYVNNNNYVNLPAAFNNAGLEVYFNKLGVTGNVGGGGTKAAAIAAKLLAVATAINDAVPNSANVGTVVPDAEHLKLYKINAALNPVYMIAKTPVTDTDISDNNLTEVFANPLIQHGGGGPAFALGGPPLTPGTEISFPYLYGPPVTGTGYKLVTETPHGDPAGTAVNNSQIANANVAAAFTALRNAVLGNITGALHENNNYVVMAAAMTIATNLLKNQINFAGVNRDVLTQELEEAIANLGKFLVRSGYVSNNIGAKITDLYNHRMKDFRESFVNEFIRSSGRVFTMTNNKATVRAIPGFDIKPSNLTDDKIWNFYSNVVAKNVTFYNEYFNLIRLAPTRDRVEDSEENLDAALGVDPTERQNYRLNVKKNTGYSRLRNILTGGAADQFGDIVFVTFLPLFTPGGTVTGMWLNADQYIAAADMNTQIIRNLARRVYNTARATTEILFNGRTVNIPQAIASTLSSTNVLIPGAMDLKGLLSSIASSDGLFGSTWREGEIAISEHMLRHGNYWKREDNEYVLYDKDNNRVSQTLVDDCSLFSTSVRECIDTLTACLNTDSDNLRDFRDQCSILLDPAKYNLNPGSQDLKERIQKMDPVLAYAILKKFGFSSHMVNNDPYPFPGFNRLKVQTVGSWLQMMAHEKANACRGQVNPGGKCGTLHDILGREMVDQILDLTKDSSKHSFLNYLDILVNWVNANPQVLNREMVVNPRFRGNYPKPSDQFNTYTHVDPYRSVRARLVDRSCGLERLKADILNDLSGAKSNQMLSDMVHTPGGISMPLNRNAFINPFPLSGFGIIQSGGHFFTPLQVSRIHEPQGFKLFSDIYRDIMNTMTNISGSARTDLTDKTKMSIEKKLENFRKSEEELRASLKNTNERIQLWQASRGNINPFAGLDDKDNFAQILAKHSNLLASSSAYNRRAVKLIDIFQAISKTLLGKLQEEGSGDTYYRPMTMGYNYKTNVVQ